MDNNKKNSNKKLLRIYKIVIKYKYYLDLVFKTNIDKIQDPMFIISEISVRESNIFLL